MKLVVAGLAGLGSCALHADELPQLDGTSGSIDSIGMAGLQEAFRVMRSKYIHRESLTPLEINRAALQGVVERLDFGAELVTGAPAAPPYEATFRGETILGTIGYLRPTEYSVDELPSIDAAIESFDEKVKTMILDLRAPAPHGDFAIAAEIADRFVPEGKTLIKIHKPDDDRPRVFASKRQPSWSRRLVVLIDGESNNVAECCAAAISKNVPAFLIGSPTPGRTVEYQNISISTGITLRLAVAEALLGDGTSLFRVGAIPDLPSQTDATAKITVFSAPADQSLAPFVFETQRPRMNEAALVQKTNPELPYLVSRTKKEETQFDSPPVIDRVLQSAIDLIQTDSFVEELPAPVSENEEPDAEVDELPDPAEAEGE